MKKSEIVKEIIDKIENSMVKTTISFKGSYFVGMTLEDWDKLKQSLQEKDKKLEVGKEV